MFHVLHRFWRWLLARLGYCGGAHFLAGAPSLPPPLTPEQEKALLARMAAGDAAARDDLITHNLRLVVYLAKKYESSGVPAEDMISIGTIGLIKAVNTFTPERSIKLATYASRWLIWFSSLPRISESSSSLPSPSTFSGSSMLAS